jgi:hypothetical protein
MYGRAPDKLRICVFYAMKTSKNACIIRSECTFTNNIKKKDEGVVKILPAVVCVFSLADRDFIWTSPLVGFCHMLGESVAYYHMQF